MTNTTSTETRTHYRLESRRADGSKGWERRAASVNLESTLAALRTSADESPHLNWRAVSGSPFGDARDPLCIYAVRGAV